MTGIRIAAAAVLASGLFALTHGAADARIMCSGNFQHVNGQPVATLYCMEQELARVARIYGWHVSVNDVRYSESKKASVCRAIGTDTRVQQICGPYNFFGGDKFSG